MMLLKKKINNIILFIYLILLISCISKSYEFKSSKLIENYVVTDINKINNELIFSSCLFRGVSIYNIEKENIYNLLENSLINDIVSDNNNIWFATENNGLISINIKSFKYNYYNTIKIKRINTIKKLNNYIICGIDNGFFVINLINNEIIIKNINNLIVYDIIIVENKIYFGCNQGLYSFNIDNMKIDFIKKLKNDNIYDLFYFDNEIFLLTINAIQENDIIMSNSEIIKIIVSIFIFFILS